jgi:hypothetical protein
MRLFGANFQDARDDTVEDGSIDEPTDSAGFVENLPEGFFLKWVHTHEGARRENIMVSDGYWLASPDNCHIATEDRSVSRSFYSVVMGRCMVDKQWEPENTALVTLHVLVPEPHGQILQDKAREVGDTQKSLSGLVKEIYDQFEMDDSFKGDKNPFQELVKLFCGPLTAR